MEKISELDDEQLASVIGGSHDHDHHLHQEHQSHHNYSQKNTSISITILGYITGQNNINIILGNYNTVIQE